MLTVIVPVFNDEGIVAPQINRVLDIVADIASRFEILIVDDASDDQTEDEARRLTLDYPQVRYLRHTKRLGMIRTVQTGMEAGRGQQVFVQHVRGPIRSSQLRQLWHDAQGDENLPQPELLSDDLIQRLGNWGEQLQSVPIKRHRSSTIDSAQ